MKVVQFVALLLFSLVTGVMWGTWFSLSRSIAAITPQTFLEVGQTMIGNLGSSMPLLMPAAVVAGIVMCVMLFRRRQRAGFTLAAVSVALLLGVMTITLVVNVPIDRQIQSWTMATLPSDWTAIRDRWEFYHGLRTFLSVLSLACLFGSALSVTGGVDATRDGRVRR